MMSRWLELTGSTDSLASVGDAGFLSYDKPLRGLADSWILKTLVSLLAALFTADPEPVALVCILVIIDFVSGIYAAKRKKQKIRSKIMRRTGVKVIEYIVLLSLITAVSNTFELVDWAAPMAYLYVSLTELFSIMENMTGSKSRARTIWMKIVAEIKDRESVDITVIEPKPDETSEEDNARSSSEEK